VRDDQWTDPTPCTDWNVRDLVNHVAVGNFAFASILRGEPRAAPGAPPGSVRDLLKAYRDSAAAVLDAFRQPGVLEQVFTVPFGPVPGIVALHLRITEILVHGWDLARATGQGFTSDAVSVVFLTLAAGSILYVVVQLLGVAAKARRPNLIAYGLLLGLLAGFLTDAIVTAAGA